MSTNNEKHRLGEIPSLSEHGQGTTVVKVRDVEYAREDCIEDIKDLAEKFPERRITRDFYRQNGNTPETAWTGLFGSFPEFLRASGLEHTRYANKVRLQAAKHASMDKLKEISEARKSYGNLYKRDKSGRWKTMVACSDLHDKEVDPFYVRVLLKTIKQVEPDVVCLDGDILWFLNVIFIN